MLKEYDHFKYIYNAVNQFITKLTLEIHCSNTLSPRNPSCIQNHFIRKLFASVISSDILLGRPNKHLNFQFLSVTES